MKKSALLLAGLVIIAGVFCCHSAMRSAAHEVDLSNIQPPFPEQVIPREELASRTAEVLEPFKDATPLPPEELLAAMEALARSNLVFDRHLPEDDPMTAFLHPAPQVKKLRNSIEHAKVAAKAFADAKDSDRLHRLIRAQMEIASKYRSAPSWHLEAITVAELDRAAFDMATQAKNDGLLATDGYAALMAQYAPTREEYTAALKSALNGDTGDFDATIALVYMKEIPEELQRKLALSEDHLSFGEHSPKELRKELNALGGPDAALQANRDIANAIVDDFANSQASHESCERRSEAYKDDILHKCHLQVCYIPAIQMEEVLGLYSKAAM